MAMTEAAKIWRQLEIPLLAPDADARIQISPLDYLYRLCGKRRVTWLEGLDTTICISKNWQVEPYGYEKPPFVEVDIWSRRPNNIRWQEGYVIEPAGVTLTSNWDGPVKIPYAVPFGSLPRSPEIRYRSLSHWMAAQVALFVKYRGEISSNIVH